MGFLDFIFGKKDIEVTTPYTGTARVVKVEETLANKLAEEATQLKKEKKYEEALNKFLEALKADGGNDFSIQIKLRLPMYYQLLGRRDEAWKALQDLSHTHNSPFELAPIHSKMKIQLQKEKKYQAAFPHDIFAFIMGIQRHQELVEQDLKTIDQLKKNNLDTSSTEAGLKKDKERVRNDYTKEAVSNMLEPLLKKAKMEDIAKSLMSGIITIGDEIYYNGHKAHYIEVHDLCKSVFIHNGYLEA